MFEIRKFGNDISNIPSHRFLKDQKKKLSIAPVVPSLFGLMSGSSSIHKSTEDLHAEEDFEVWDEQLIASIESIFDEKKEESLKRPLHGSGIEKETKRFSSITSLRPFFMSSSSHSRDESKSRAKALNAGVSLETISETALQLTNSHEESFYEPRLASLRTSSARPVTPPMSPIHSSPEETPRKYDRTFLLSFQAHCVQPPDDLLYVEGCVSRSLTPSKTASSSFSFPSHNASPIHSHRSMSHVTRPLIETAGPFPSRSYSGPYAPSWSSSMASGSGIACGFPLLPSFPALPSIPPVPSQWWSPATVLDGPRRRKEEPMAERPRREKPRELDARRLAARQKQLDIGMNTLGYRRFLELIPESERNKGQWKMPDKFQVCSKRSWDGQVRKWRRMLHTFDPLDAKEEEALSKEKFSSDENSEDSANEDLC